MLRLYACLGVSFLRLSATRGHSNVSALLTSLLSGLRLLLGSCLSAAALLPVGGPDTCLYAESSALQTDPYAISRDWC